MRVIDIVENMDGELLRSCLCYTGINAAGNASFSGREKDLFLLPPGGARELPENGAGFVLSGGEFPHDFYLSLGDCFFRSEYLAKSPLRRLKVIEGGFVGLSRRGAFLRPVRGAVLTVSDKGSRGERTDTSGPSLKERLAGIGCDTEERAIVPDSMDEIVARLQEWSDKKDYHLILCTGGTGFSSRDVTPEALESVAEKFVPGIGEAMRSASLKITPRAILSRAGAVIRGGTLIISLPGSEKAALECFDAISGSLRHGIEILRGWEGECGSAGIRKGERKAGG